VLGSTTVALTPTLGLQYLRLNDFQHTTGPEELCTNLATGERRGFVPGK
jgi:hypothetical protein